MKRLFLMIAVMTACMMLAACGTAKTSEKTKAKPATSNIKVVENGSAEANEDKNTKTLVVYFSCTGNTKTIAQYIAGVTNAHIFEIKPEQPYTSEDLDYRNDNSRSSRENDDPAARPVIANTVANFDQYDTVYVGYPIWWGDAPRILNTFVEKYDLSNKKVITFCTAASSGMGASSDKLKNTAKGKDWTTGKRFYGKEDVSEISDWVKSLK